SILTEAEANQPRNIVRQFDSTANRREAGQVNRPRGSSFAPRQELARGVVGESGGSQAGFRRDGSALNEPRPAQLADEDLVGSVPVAENVGTKTAQDISGRSNLRQRHRRGVA